MKKNITRFTVNQKLPLSELYKKLDEDKQNFFCVVDSQEKIVGVLSLGDIARSHGMTAKNNKHTVSDIMNTNYHSLKYGVAISTLNNSLEKYRFVPIIDEFNHIKLLATGDPKKKRILSITPLN